MDSRTKNSKRNIIFSYLYVIINFGFQFVSRSIILSYLGSEYLGLSSLFNSILHFLNMAELGFAGAIVYNMYKPLAEKDELKICSLLNYYKKIYRKIGSIILCLGIMLIPFIKYLIKGGYPSDINIYFIFSLFLLNTVISYFLFAYKTSLLEAAQRMDIVKISYLIISFIQYPFQILSLVCFKNYYLFVGLMILGTGAKNILAAFFSKKHFPMYYCKGDISVSVKENISQRVKGLMIGSISSATSTIDTIVLSSFVGLLAVAKYNNYILIMTGIGSVIALLRNGMQSSVGNSVAVDSVEKNYNDLYLWQFLFSVIASMCVSCMFALYQPFMKIWMGEHMLLSLIDVIIICLIFNVGIIQHSYYLYLSACGLWWELRWAYLFEVIANLFLNILLGKLLGITGVLLSTLFSVVISGLFWQCNLIFKNYFCKSSKTFFQKQFLYFLVSIIVAVINYFVCMFCGTKISGKFGFILQVFISVLLSGLLLFLIYFRTNMFKKSILFFLRVIRA